MIDCLVSVSVVEGGMLALKHIADNRGGTLKILVPVTCTNFMSMCRVFLRKKLAPNRMQLCSVQPYALACVTLVQASDTSFWYQKLQHISPL